MARDLLKLSLQLQPSQKLKLTMADMDMVGTEAMEDIMVDTVDMVVTVVSMAKDLLTLNLKLVLTMEDTMEDIEVMEDIEDMDTVGMAAMAMVDASMVRLNP